MPNEENLKKVSHIASEQGNNRWKQPEKAASHQVKHAAGRKPCEIQLKCCLICRFQKAAKELKQKLAVMGISEEDFTYQTAVMVGVINQAMKGNTKAAAFLRDTVGENPAHELRERELDQKIAEFEYHREQEEAQRKENESTSSLADAIEEAYRNRMEAEKDAEQ